MDNRVNFGFSRSCMAAIAIASTLIICFFILELIELPYRFQVFFSLLVVGGILYVLYLAVSRRKIHEDYLILGIGLLIIINKLYDPAIFEECFSISFPIGVLLAVSVTILRICSPLFVRMVRRFRESVLIVEEVLPTELTTGESSVLPIQTSSMLHTDAKTMQNIAGEVSEQIQESAYVQMVQSDVTPNEQTIKTVKQTLYSRGKNFFTNIDYPLLGELSITVLLLGMSVWFSKKILDWVVVYEEIEAEHILRNVNMLIPFALIGLLATIVIFILLCTYSKLVRVMIHILKGEDSPTIYVLGILLVSLFVSKSGYFSQDQILNFFTEGNFFSFPIVAVIIYPFFVLSANTLNQLLKDHRVYQKMLDAASALAKKVLKIVYDIMDSTIRLIQFVTSDFLGSMLAIIEATEEEEAECEGDELPEDAILIETVCLDKLSEDSYNTGKEDDKFKEDTEDEC